MMKDIENIEDIKVFVDSFYAKVREDDLLNPIFMLKIKPEEWDAHLKKMYGFWNTVLFFKGEYKGNPASKHITLPIDLAHFERWVSLFCLTIDEHFEGVHAAETKLRAGKMASLFLSKIEYSRNNPNFISLF